MTVVVTYSGWDVASGTVQVSAYVDGVLPPGGVCSLQLTNAAGTATATSVAEPDATTTTCGTIEIPATAVSKGTWNGTVSYKAATAAGTSAPLTIEVP